MRLSPTLPLVAAFVLGTALPSVGANQSTQQSPPSQAQPKPEQKPESKTPPSIAGKWTLTVETQQGSTPSAMEIKLDGKKVAGSISGPQGEIAIEGEFSDGKLTFSISFQTSNGPLAIVFSGAQKEDGTLAGTMDFGQGQAPWKAERPKQ